MPHNGQTGVKFNSGGYTLFGALYMAQGDDPKPTVVLLHGMPGIEKNIDMALALRDAGWNSLIFHYRGCWGSEGVYHFPTMPGDVIAALDYLQSGVHPQVDPDRLYLVGHSMGGWAAVLAAARDPRPRAVAVYSAVCDPRDFTWTAEIVEAYFTPWLPGLTSQAFLENWAAMGDDLVPVEQVGKVSPRPLLIIHGEEDETIPSFQADALYRAADPDHTTLALHPDANHSFTWHRPWLIETLLGWLGD